MAQQLFTPLRVIIGAVVAILVLSACGPTAPSASSTCDVGTNGENPVVIVGGTFTNTSFNDIFLGNRFKAAEFTTCTFELLGDPTLGNIPGTAPIATSADSLAVYVEDVLAWSGASQVDIVAHSQGGLVARQFIRFDSGEPLVDDLVTLGGPHHGTDTAGLAAMFIDVLGPFGVTCAQISPCAEMQEGSATLSALNAGDESFGSVDYHAFVSAFDEVVWTVSQGVETGFLSGGANNVRVQDQCPLRWVGHGGLFYDEVTFEMASDAVSGQSVNVPLWKCVLPTLPF